jgi:outer membrane receptor protein involved in Fe transport
MSKKLAYIPTLFLIFIVSHHFLLAQSASDSLKSKELTEFVISASRIRENALSSPVSIHSIDFKKGLQSSKFSIFDALENMKDLQVIVPSLGFKVYNARGFANTTNVRFIQLVDGVDNQAPHIGAPIANAFGASDLDIERVEVLPGASSALYGMNALNGLINFITKNPFEHQGLQVQQKLGLNHLGSEVSPKLFNETNVYYAKVLSPKFAFKINGTFMRGYDWLANNATDLNPNGNRSVNLLGMDNPAPDFVNAYGNESSNRRTLSLSGRNYVVSRTGYYEREIADYHLDNRKGDIQLVYVPKKNIELSYTYKIGTINNIYQRTNRFRFDDYLLQQHSFQLKTNTLQFRSYYTEENTGISYNIRSMAENIDRSFKSDNQWFADYGRQFNGLVANGIEVAQAHRQARTFADVGRPAPNTPQFDQLIDSLRRINNWDIGAALQVKTQMFHAEAQYDLAKGILKKLANQLDFQLLAGVDYRLYSVYPDGNYFINPNPSEQGRNLRYGRSGAFLQLFKYFLEDKLKIGATLRIDKNDYFAPKLTPRFSAVYSPKQNHNFRFSYQQGYRFPSLFEAFSNVNSGGVKRVGGLPIMSEGIFENSYYRTSIDAFQTAVNNDVNRNRLPLAVAIENNKNLIIKNDYTYLKPEAVRSFEVGYKGNIKNRLQIEADVYYNIYRNFIAQIEANVPKTQNPDSLAIALYDRTKQERYRLWTNSKTRVYSYGASASLAYNFYKDFMLTSNVTYSALDRSETNDGLEEAFNTPNWVINVGVSNASIIKNLGFSMNYKWQSAFLWQSALATGEVAPIRTLDAQVSYTLPKQYLSLKLGANNLLNQYYYSFIGGSQIGGFYYFSALLDLTKR